jgi:thiosulfate dehydrogenase [quinone] large subunit
VDVTFSDPPIAQALFHSTRAGLLIWMPVRTYLGYEWLKVGLGQLRDPTWLDGSQVLAFWWDAVDGQTSYDQTSSSLVWYRGFLNGLIDANASELFARLVVFGELAVGLALIVGAFVGIAAFGGALMNMNFMLAGEASSNPVLFLGAIGLMLAWRVAGHYGADRWLLPSIGTPWHGEEEVRTGPP